jgi:thiol:disulfide interchange protein
MLSHLVLRRLSWIRAYIFFQQITTELPLMKKILLISTLLVLLASCNKTPTSLDTVAILQDNTQMIQSGSMMQKKESWYQIYTPELVESALKNNQKVVLFFAASWCSPCKALDVAIRSDLGSIPTDSLIVKVNYDTSTALKQKYKVVIQHTTVVLNSDSSEKSKKIGAKTVAEVIGK